MKIKNIIFIILFLVIIFFTALFILNSNTPNNNQTYDSNNNENIISSDFTNSSFKNYISENVISENIILENIVTKNNVVKKENTTIQMSVIGDIMCHNSQYNDAYKNGKYDFSYVFDDIKPYIENSDISIGNLETTFAGSTKGYSSYPTFNTPEALAYNLKDLGIDVLSTANNHSLDTGYAGLESTINYLDDAGISHTGTFKSQENQNSILFKEVNDIKIAFLSYTYGTNGIPIPQGKEYCINLIDKNLISSHLELAKQGNPDLICVNMHWGTEYQTTPNNTQNDLATFLFENGVDIILGSHPHVLQQMQKYSITMPDGLQKDGFAIYSLGNFMSGQDKENTRNSIILNLEIIKNGETEKISIGNISYIPIYTFTSPKYKNYKVLDIQKAINNYESGIDTSIGEYNYNLLKSELTKVHSLLNFK